MFVGSGENERENLTRIAIDLKDINKSLRCLGIFKFNSKKTWKLT
jgi:hypothetical protein